MKLFIGLGNYGDQYAHTRHNAGFEVIDRLSDRWHIPVTRARCHGLIGEGTVGGERVALIKPQTYMTFPATAWLRPCNGTRCSRRM